MTFSSITSSKDLEFGVAHIDVASSEKRLVRVTTNTYKNSGITYINIKLFKKKGSRILSPATESGTHCQGVSGNDSECGKH